MDTSNEYIEMCEKAVEMQANVEVTEEIIYAQKWTSRLASSNSLYLCYMGIGKWKYDQRYIKNDQFLDENENGLSLVWLPRQDELQEMLAFKSVRSQLKALNKFCINLTYKSKDSWEQLWLRIVMKEVYQKEWIKNNWIKI